MTKCVTCHGKGTVTAYGCTVPCQCRKKLDLPPWTVQLFIPKAEWRCPKCAEDVLYQFERPSVVNPQRTTRVYRCTKHALEFATKHGLEAQMLELARMYNGV